MFTGSVLAASIGPSVDCSAARRPLLVLLEDGAVTMLPSSTTERPDLGRAEAGRTIELADVALDPDFGTNRFLYFAAVATDAYGRRTVSVVRVRELADRMGRPRQSSRIFRPLQLDGRRIRWDPTGVSTSQWRRPKTLLTANSMTARCFVSRVMARQRVSRAPCRRSWRRESGSRPCSLGMPVRGCSWHQGIPGAHR